MSIKKPQFFILLIFGICFGLYRHFFPVPKNVHRTIGSTFNASQYSSRGVVDRIIHLKFETSQIRKIDSSGLTEVVAFVSMPFDFDGQLEYKWTLGQNVRVIQGTLDGFSQIGFQRESPQKIKLVVQGFDKSELRHIGFEIWGDKKGRRIYADGLISSQQESSFEDIVQHVEKMKAEKTGIHK